jgi:hypothetical protein
MFHITAAERDIDRGFEDCSHSYVDLVTEIYHVGRRAVDIELVEH